MRVQILILVVLCGLGAANCLTGSIWPKPLQLEESGGNAFVDSNLQFICNGGSCAPSIKLLKEQFDERIKLLLPLSDPHQVVIHRVNIKYEDVAPLTLESDESYKMNVTAWDASISAPSVWGATYAVQTFIQALEKENGILTLSTMYIYDKPRFAHRGLMLDSARHFMPVEIIKRQINMMAQTKLNVFHWHAVDAQSFPINISDYPELAQKGAFDRSKIYSSKDISTVINYAEERGIRVIMEFDVPGHSNGWGMGRHDIVAHCPKYEHNINNIALDISNDDMYDVLENVLTEMYTLLKKPQHMHLGGDEVVTYCWLNDPKIAAWMNKMGYSRLEAFAHFESKLTEIINRLGFTPIYWNEVFDRIGASSIPKNAIFQFWTGEKILSIIQKGYKAIISPSSEWYLNCGFNPSCKFHSWEAIYQYEPVPTGATPSEAALVIGGEAAMWAEYADDTSIEGQIWPRAAAAAERLWSESSVQDVTDARTRLDEFRCRLHRQGYRTTPIHPGYCDIDSPLV